MILNNIRLDGSFVMVFGGKLTNMVLITASQENSSQIQPHGCDGTHKNWVVT